MVEKWEWKMEPMGYPVGNGYLIRLKSPIIQCSSVIMYFSKLTQDSVSYFLKDENGMNVGYLSKTYHTIEECVQ